MRALTVSLGLVIALLSTAQATLWIDNYSIATDAYVMDPPGINPNSLTTSNATLGGNRILDISLVGGSTIDAAIYTSGTGTFNTGFISYGIFEISYNSFGSQNLVTAGDTFIMDVWGDPTKQVSMYITVQDSSLNNSTSATQFSQNISNWNRHYFSYSSFTGTADLTDITAIKFTFSNNLASATIDIAFDNFHIVTIPEPSILGLNGLAGLLAVVALRKKKL